MQTATTRPTSDCKSRSPRFSGAIPAKALATGFNRKRKPINPDATPQSAIRFATTGFARPKEALRRSMRQ